MFSFFKKLFGVNELPSPSDIVPRNMIVIEEGRVIVNLHAINISLKQPPRVWIPPIPDTGSMDAVFDAGHNNILIAGQSKVDHQKIIDFIKEGDIAVYMHPSLYAIHRVVKIGQDNEGRYFIFKGDNNVPNDPYKVRDSMIRYLSIGTIY